MLFNVKFTDSLAIINRKKHLNNCLNASLVSMFQQHVFNKKKYKTKLKATILALLSSEFDTSFL